LLVAAGLKFNGYYKLNYGKIEWVRVRVGIGRLDHSFMGGCYCIHNINVTVINVTVVFIFSLLITLQ